MFILLEMEGNSQSRLFSSMPWGKKATTLRRSRALGSRLRNVGEASKSSMVVARFLLCVEMEWTPIRDRLPDHRLHCYKHGTLAPDDDRSMTNRPVEALG